MKKFDADGDGNITEDEYLRVVCNLPSEDLKYVLNNVAYIDWFLHSAGYLESHGKFICKCFLVDGCCLVLGKDVVEICPLGGQCRFSFRYCKINLIALMPAE